MGRLHPRIGKAEEKPVRSAHFFPPSPGPTAARPCAIRRVGNMPCPRLKMCGSPPRMRQRMRVTEALNDLAAGDERERVEIYTLEPGRVLGQLRIGPQRVDRFRRGPIALNPCLSGRICGRACRPAPLGNPIHQETPGCFLLRPSNEGRARRGDHTQCSELRPGTSFRPQLFEQLNNRLGGRAVIWPEEIVERDRFLMRLEWILRRNGLGIRDKAKAPRLGPARGFPPGPATHVGRHPSTGFRQKADQGSFAGLKRGFWDLGAPSRKSASGAPNKS